MKHKCKLSWFELHYIQHHSLIHIQVKKLTTPISSLKMMKCSVLIALVRTSASCFWVLTWTISSNPFWTLLCKKWYLVSICLLLPCVTKFFERLMPDLLSIINLTGLLTLNFNSCSKFISQIVWQANNSPNLYYASQIDNLTTSCFLEHQEMRALRYMNMYSLVLLLSTPSPHQLESEWYINSTSSDTLDRSNITL